MRWCLPHCEADARNVKVDYTGIRNDTHRFRVSSMSRPGYNHLVYVKIGTSFNHMRNLTPERMIYEGFVRVYSTDPWWRYGGCAYYHTQFNAALKPEFRAPLYPEHDCVVSHTELAVLELLARLGPGILTSNFSAMLNFDENKNRYSFV